LSVRYVFFTRFNWGSILAGKDGRRGFIHHPSPQYNMLSIEAELWEGELFLNNMKTFDREKYSTLIAGDWC